MTLYMLDTNIASHVIRGDIPLVRQRLLTVPMESLTISAITEAELRYGVAKRGHPKSLTHIVALFLERVDILPWTTEVAAIYGNLRAACEASGQCLAPMDMMIAAHAKATESVLVTRDKAFRQPSLGLSVQDWSQEASH